MNNKSKTYVLVFFNTNQISLFSKIAIFNLLLVAILGVLMRYKIAFEFPFFMQKYAQHSHSHFAFLGWVSFTLMFLIMDFIINHYQLNPSQIKKYNLTFILNIIISYILLFSFLLTGYSKLSIIFSTFSILVSYYFTYISFIDLKKINSLNKGLLKSEIVSNLNIIINYLRFSLIFMVISSFGTFSLAYMNAMKIFEQEWYLSSIYFYLHFQYNGWFFFGLLGILLAYVNQVSIKHKLNIIFNKNIFLLFAISSVPAYLLSILWANLSNWLYLIVIFTVIVQLYALFLLLKDINYVRKIIYPYLSYTFKLLISLVIISVIIKFILQALTLLPELSKLAYEFRPIVISYLHLVLLCIISLGLISLLFERKFINSTKMSLIGIYSFVVGIFINEIILTIQGIASFSYILLPYTNELLFFNSLIILTGIAVIFLSLLIRKKM